VKDCVFRIASHFAQYAGKKDQICVCARVRACKATFAHHPARRECFILRQ